MADTKGRAHISLAESHRCLWQFSMLHVIRSLHIIEPHAPQGRYYFHRCMSINGGGGTQGLWSQVPSQVSGSRFFFAGGGAVTEQEGGTPYPRQDWDTPAAPSPQ